MNQVQKVLTVIGVASGRKVKGSIRSMVNARSLQLEFVRGLHEELPVLF